jgi:hypothetical protein
MLVPQQYLDAFILDANGVTPTSNHQAKRRLGLSDVPDSGIQ